MYASDIDALQLTNMATCDVCGRELVTVRIGSIPEHKAKGVFCSGAGYSARKDSERYVIETKMKANRVAQLLASDNGNCLYSGDDQHSLTCGDGKHCEKHRRMLSSALANYFLENL